MLTFTTRWQYDFHLHPNNTTFLKKINSLFSKTVRYAIIITNKTDLSPQKEDSMHQTGQCLDRLISAGIGYHAMLMLGIAGRGEGVNNAKATALFLNQHKPISVSLTTTAVSACSPLGKMLENGDFIEATERENIDEMFTLLDEFEMDENCRFVTTHPLNSISVSGTFAEKERLLSEIKAFAAEYTDEELDSVLGRRSI